MEAGSPIFLDMTEWALTLWDPGRWLAGYLDRLRATMAVHATECRASKGGYYWDYKPDFKPGEVVTL